MSGEVQVLTDTYGRILTQHDPDGDVRTAVVWVPGDSRIDWDDASDQELVTLLGKYGYNDALTIENNNVTINDNGETETLIWDSAAMDFTVDVDMFQNGAQNMYFRTVNDGSQDVTVLCDADGKAIMAPTLGEYTGVLFSVANNGTEIDTITYGSSISAAAVIQACGGSVNVTALDAGDSVFLLVMGTHVQFCNADYLSTTPPVNPYQGPVTHVVARITDGRDSDTAPTGVVSGAWLHLYDTITEPRVFTNNNSKLRFEIIEDLPTVYWSSLEDENVNLFQGLESPYPITPNVIYLTGSIDASLLNNVFEAL